MVDDGEYPFTVSYTWYRDKLPSDGDSEYPKLGAKSLYLDGDEVGEPPKTVDKGE